MTFLRDLINKAKGFLGNQPRLGEATDAVRHTRFDGMIFDELLDEAPALREMVTGLNQEWDYTDDMVRDVLMEFWQGDPQLRPSQEMRPGWLTNRSVADYIQGSPNTDQARSYTVHDRYSAAMATLAVAEEIDDYLHRHKEEQEQAQAAADAAEQAQSESDSAQSVLSEAMASAEESGWPEIGPPSPTQQAAAGALQQALEQAQAQAQAAQATAENAQQAHDQATADLRQPVQQGIQKAHDNLEEEANLMASWGIEDGVLQRMSFDERARLAERLRNNRMSKFTDLIGRFRMMGIAQQARKVEYGRDEVVGVELSGDMSRLVPVELTRLAVPELQLDFLRRMAESRLLSRRYRGTEKVGKGAIIAVIDCSGSMGSPGPDGISGEAWAKAFALALLDQAARSKRDFVAILFSSASQQHTIEFPRGDAPLDKVMELAEHFYGGGTDFMRPLSLAVDKLAAEFDRDGKMKGDVVFITDGTARVTPDWMATYQARKAKLGFRTFGIQCGRGGYGNTLEALSDNVRTVEEFTDPAIVHDIFRVVE